VQIPNLLTTALAAAQTGIPKRTIIAAITRGDLPAVKLPGITGAYLIAPDALQGWLDSRPKARA
jgi:excisionase family DNA binding protein